MTRVIFSISDCRSPIVGRKPELMFSPAPLPPRSSGVPGNRRGYVNPPQAAKSAITLWRHAHFAARSQLCYSTCRHLTKNYITRLGLARPVQKIVPPKQGKPDDWEEMGCFARSRDRERPRISGRDSCLRSVYWRRPSRGPLWLTKYSHP